MHICFVAIDYHEGQSGGGIGSYLSTIGPALVRQGHRVTILAKGHTRSESYEQGMHIVRVPLGSAHWYMYKLRAPSIAVLPLRELEWSLGLRLALNRLMKDELIDVVESSEIGNVFLVGRKGGLPPLVVRLHGDPYVFAKYSGLKANSGLKAFRRLELRALGKAAGVTSPSHFQAREMARALRWEPSRIDVVPNPTSPWFLQQALDGKLENSNSQQSGVLYTGRIEYRKGIIPLLLSVKSVLAQQPNTQYVLAGARHSSIDDSTLDKVLDEEGVRGAVRFLGHVPWHDLATLYRQAAIFVMPSYYETFGISCLEAMAFGLPVVATAAGGLSEVVEHEVTGILVPPGDHQLLAEAITRLLRNPDLRKRMGEAGRQRVIDEFSADRVVAKTIEIYGRIK